MPVPEADEDPLPELLEVEEAEEEVDPLEVADALNDAVGEDEPLGVDDDEPVEVRVGERLFVLVADAEFVLEGLDEDDEDALDVGTAVAVEDELAEALGVRVREAVDESLALLVGDDDAEGVDVTLAVDEELRDELEEDEPLGV